jgi:3-oxoacyl-[acyl-carrier-protein] synthase-1/3-oxoacyl-[acyl-carrier-protein] synthase II
MDSLFTCAPVPAPPVSCPGSQHPVFEVPDRFLPEDNPVSLPGSRAARLALKAAEEALADAGLNPEMLGGKKIGVMIGTNVSGGVSNRSLQQQDALEVKETGSRLCCPSSAERFLAVNPAQWIARHFNFSGPCQTIVNACSAGGDAIGLAGSWIRSGRCDMVIAGGVDVFYEVTYYGFIALMNCDIEPCKPYDAHRNGLNLGEGAGILVLESDRMLAHRGKRARAFITGYGMASDAYHFTSPDPDAGGLRLAIQDALNSAGARPSDIAFINAHGTGTRDNDRIESHLFHDLFQGVPFGSTKGYTGHTLGASGAIEAAFTISCLERQQMPASAGFSEPDPELPAHPVQEKTPIRGATAFSETLAFGGNNSVLIFTTENDS